RSRRRSAARACSGYPPNSVECRRGASETPAPRSTAYAARARSVWTEWWARARARGAAASSRQARARARAGPGLAGVVTTGATAVLRGAALFSGETGSLPLPVRGGTITSQAIAMVTAPPADEYTVVRFLRTSSGKLAWTRAIVDL